jgi:hypothetical protein
VLEELFRKAVQLGQKIAIEDNVRFRELLDRARELWTEYDPKPDAGNRIIMGVDSGWNVRLYEGFYVYALRAAAVDERQRVHEPVVEFDRIGGHSDLTPENYVKYQGEIAEPSLGDAQGGLVVDSRGARGPRPSKGASHDCEVFRHVGEARSQRNHHNP